MAILKHISSKNANYGDAEKYLYQIDLLHGSRERITEREYWAQKKGQLAQGEARLRRAQHEEKILEHQMKQLTRKERTHRLCTRGAMLESFLTRPEVLTDDDVMDILKQAFS